MNSIFNFMNSFLVATIFLNVLAPHRTSAAVCGAQTNSQCVASDYTVTTCNKDNRCDCLPGYQPIPTGCAPSPPTVEFGTNIGQRVSDTTDVKLTCFTKEPGTLTFDWTHNGTKISQPNTAELTRTGDDAAVLGNYSCTVKDSASGKVLGTSDVAKIVALNANSVIPVVRLQTQSAAADVLMSAQCVGIPFGAIYKFRLDSSTTPIDSVTAEQYSKHTNITCVLDDSIIKWKTKESAPVKMPTEAKDITGVTISPSIDFMVKTGDTVTFTCGSIPDDTFMVTGTITYSFLDSGEVKQPNAGKNQYTVTSTNPTSRNVSCSAKYDGAREKHQSATVTVSFNTSDTPSLRASSTTVYPGSPLILTCLTDPIAQITWVKDDKNITGETERIIQFGNFRPEDAGKYLCSATKNAHTANSTWVTITSKAPQVPVLGSAVTALVAVLAVFGWRVL